MFFPLFLLIDKAYSTNTISATADEGTQLILTAPQGNIFTSVDFASYGTPINYTIDPNCHADFTAYIYSIFVGKNTGTADANNGIAGDPCGGIYKHLSIILSYAPDPNYIAPTPPPNMTLNPPTSVTAVLDTNTQNIILNWQSPVLTDVSVERYAILWHTSTTNGWGVATGNVGDSTALNTTISIPISVITQDGFNKEYIFAIRSDNDTLGIYSCWSDMVTVFIADIPLATLTPTPTPTPTVIPDPIVIPQPIPEPIPTPTPTLTPISTPIPIPSPEPTIEPSPSPTPTPIIDPTPESSQSSTPSPIYSPTPKPTPTPTLIPESKPITTELIKNNPNDLPTDKPLLPSADLLIPKIQIDKPNVENGGIQFFGTQQAPQVIGEDGKLTPPAPAPGSGLPIPPDAITTTDTFIGQPGGTTFNSPDIAVPVELQPLEGAIAAVPGAEALNQAYVALANIGNDMSPITRKKAKKILVVTVAVAAFRRRFGG